MMSVTGALGIMMITQSAASLCAVSSRRNASNEGIKIDAEPIVQCALANLNTAVQCKKILEAQGIDLLESPEFRDMLLMLGGFECDFGKGATFKKLQEALKDGTYREKFPVGRLIPDKWIDVSDRAGYNAPLRVVDYHDVILSDGSKKMGAVLMRQYATKGKVRFNELKNNRYSCSDIQKYLSKEYLDGCSDELKAVLAEIKVGGVAGKFFLPSLEELHVLDSPANEALSWEYFKDTSINRDDHCKKRSFKTENGKKQECWIRSEYKDFDGWACYTFDDGSIMGKSVRSSASVVPACIITE